MNDNNALNERLSSRIETEFPDFTKLPADVKQKFEACLRKLISFG